MQTNLYSCLLLFKDLSNPGWESRPDALSALVLNKYTLIRLFFKLFMENRTFSLPLTVYWIILKKICFGKNTKISLILS